MEGLIHEPIVLAALSVLATVAALAWSIQRRQGAERSRWWFACMALPGLLVLLAFYSLAIHMFSRLGGWPDFYGTERLPPEVATHARVWYSVFGVVLLAVLGMPLVLALFAAVPRLRSGMIYPASCAAASWLCLFLTALAPAGFQDWWWD